MNKQIEYYEAKLKFEIDSYDLYESLSRNENIIVVDARSAEAYAVQRIPSAINIPHRR